MADIQIVKELCNVPVCSRTSRMLNQANVETEEDSLVYSNTGKDPGPPATILTNEKSALVIGLVSGVSASVSVFACLVFAACCIVVRRRRNTSHSQLRDQATDTSALLAEEYSQLESNETILANAENADSIDVPLSWTSSSENRSVRKSSGGELVNVDLTTWLTKKPTELGIMTLHQKLGSGISSNVFRCKWMDSNVAVKVILLDTLPKYMRRNVVDSVEATSLQSISHPNVVQTFQVFKVAGPQHGAARDHSNIQELWILQELCDLGDLAHESVGYGAKDEDAFKSMLGMLIDIVKGVRFLHSRGIVHGDLKRANVIRKSHIKSGMICKVTDLGMAHILMEDQTYYFSSNTAGDFACMAPEALFDGHVSAKMDTYSLAIIMFELYTGQQAFKRGNFAEHCRALASETRPVFPPATPEAFQNLAERCWDQDPNARPSDDEVMHALQAMLTPQHDLGSDGSCDGLVVIDEQRYEPDEEAHPLGYFLPAESSSKPAGTDGEE